MRLPGMKLKLLHWHQISAGRYAQWKLSTKRTAMCRATGQCIPLYDGDDLVAALAAGKHSREAVLAHRRNGTQQPPATATPEVYIEVLGGVVDAVYSNSEGLRVTIVDWDHDEVQAEPFTASNMTHMNESLLEIVEEGRI